MRRVNAPVAAVATLATFAAHLYAEPQPAASPTFEVASVRIADASAGLIPSRGGPGTADPERYTATMPLGAYVRTYGLAVDELDGPGWMNGSSAS